MNTPPTGVPSIRPSPSVTWPMVALTLVKDLPYLAMIVSGAVVSCVLIAKGDGSTFEKIGAVVIPAIVSALAKGQPPNMGPTGLGTFGTLLLLMLRRH